MKKLLVVVDMQKDFIDGALGTLEAQQIVPAVRKRICEYREAGDEVVFTLDTHGPDYMDTMEGEKLPVPHCLKGTEGWELDAGLREFDGKRFEKVTFGSPELAEYAAAGGYERIELLGLCTDICVISNALLIKPKTPEAEICVKADCCAGVTPQSHENALNAMKMCHIDVI